MPNPVEGLLEVYEDMVQVLLVLEIFLTEDLWVEDKRTEEKGVGKLGWFMLNT